MKYVRQFLIILAFTLAGEVLKALLPLPVPAGIYGMVLLLAALVTGLLRLEQVKETGLFLVAVMPVMFIPAATGLMESFSELRAFLLPACVVTVAVLIIVFFVTGKVAQRFIKKDGSKKEGEK